MSHANVYYGDNCFIWTVIRSQRHNDVYLALVSNYLFQANQDIQFLWLYNYALVMYYFKILDDDNVFVIENE